MYFIPLQKACFELWPCPWDTSLICAFSKGIFDMVKVQFSIFISWKTKWSYTKIHLKHTKCPFTKGTFWKVSRWHALPAKCSFIKEKNPMINFQKTYPTLHNTLEKIHSISDVGVKVPPKTLKNIYKIRRRGRGKIFINYTFEALCYWNLSVFNEFNHYFLSWVYLPIW